MTQLDFPNIQGFVVRGYRLPAAGYLFLRIEEAAKARALLGDVIPDVITAERWDVKPDSGINVAFSYEGLRALGVGDDSLAGFPAEFRDGMASRKQLLGDLGDSDPAHWEDCFKSGDAHVLVMISAKDKASLSERDQNIRELVARRGGASVVVTEVGAVLPTGREHFGYADGFSQPAIAGSRFPDHPGAGAPSEKGDWRPIAAGEFILGYPDEQGALPVAPPPDELGRNGSYVVYRKLRQDVAGFRRQLAEAAELYAGGEEELAAKLVGRWRDGTPLDSSPDREDPALVEDKNRNNAFDYGGDPAGMKCPVGSHIRRMNPRLSMPFEGKLVNRHRIIRRGITYGELLPEGAEDDGADRGVIFMTVQASLARQFEFVQAQWANTGNPFRLGDDQDPIIGPMDNHGPNKMTIPGKPPFFFGPLSRVVTMRGGEYYFAPGINGLRHLAAA
ncbi:MAG TPA: Dyp-type peroxidase [Solirubrobacteraceae bacterium]|nr:Dyp-type peroxidase [Solirubrobacteraceae bacterium]